MPSITTDDLAKLVDHPQTAPFILDVRAPDQYRRWRIDTRSSSLNIPYWTAIAEEDDTRTRLPSDQEVVVVCAHGDSSDLVVKTLGLSNLRNLEGGMEAWARTLVPRVLFDDGTHFVVQFDRIAKACLSYALGVRGGNMAVIDPAADADSYLRLAAEMGSTITHLFDTHLHADHVSLGVLLSDRRRAQYHIAPGDAEGAAFEYRPLVDGETFRFGDLDLVVRSVATPGHTPGSTSLEVGGRFLMTGDAVFVTGVGRPDLGGQTEPWARDLFRTIHHRLATLDPELEICPAHYTSRSEAGEDGTLRRTLGDLLINDPVVSITDEDMFVTHVVTHLGSAPDVYKDIRLVNLGLKTVDEETVAILEVGRNECALSK